MKKLLFTLLILLVVCIFVITLFPELVSETKDLFNIDHSLDIIDIYENDSDIIKEYFSDGMELSEFKNILNQDDNYIKSTHEFKKMSYNFENNLHYSEIEEFLFNWNTSDCVKLENIGTTHDDRTIYGVEVGFGDKTIMFDGSVHAAEVSGTLYLMKFINDIVNKYEDNNDQTIDLLNNYKIILIPSINPDGYEVASFGIDSIRNHKLWIYQNKDIVNTDSFKFNANGIDINRNMPTQNAGLYYNEYNLINSVSLEKTTKSGIYYGGTSLGSEPESKAFMYFALKHYKNLYSYVNLHSMGRVIYAGKPNLSTKFNELCQNTGNLISSINSYKLHSLSSEEVGEGNDGSLTDFMAEIANGFKFSTHTGRLTTEAYKNNNVELEYPISVVTLETMKKYTQDINTIKTEYYDWSLEEVFLSLIKQY